MTQQAIEALRTEQSRALDVMRSLTADEWAAPSGCTGWRVQDVFCHMASVFHSIADPSTIEGGSSEDVEQNAEVPVQARKSWSAAQVIAEYEEWSEKGIGALAFMNTPEMRDTVIPLANLGQHPMHILANAIVFDHYCHLRHDVGAAVARAAELPHDDNALSATVEWMLAGVPQMCASALATAPRTTVNLVLEGPGGGTWTIAPGSPLWTVTEGGASGAATVVSTAHDFVSWGTKRADWRRTSRIENGSVDAEAVVDAINVI
ncbi:MAG: maleylpyruvate isomerase N-terminal domain-containing protein [Ilumatobacteraceae bacterium]